VNISHSEEKTTHHILEKCNANPTYQLPCSYYCSITRIISGIEYGKTPILLRFAIASRRLDSFGYTGDMHWAELT